TCADVFGVHAKQCHALGVLPPPAEVGYIRLRPLKVPNSGKPEFGWGMVGEGGGAIRKCRSLYRMTPTPNPSPPQARPARLAHLGCAPRESRGAVGGEHTECAALL